jgi:hypothetical protein
MWWEEFEKQLTSAFTTYNKREGRVVHSPEMKLRTLLAKVNADFLTHVKASIGIELTRQPITLTYEQALAAFRNEVNRKSPPQMSSATKTRQNINELGQGAGRGRGGRFGCGRGNPQHGGRGRGGRGNHPRQSKTRTDSTFITLSDGQQIEYHASFHFPPVAFNKMKQEEKDRLQRERKEYNRTKDQDRQIQQLQQQLSTTNKIISVKDGEGDSDPCDASKP